MRCLYLQIQNFDLQFPKLLVKSTVDCAESGHGHSCDHVTSEVEKQVLILSNPLIANHLYYNSTP